MFNKIKEYKIEEKEVDGILKYHVMFDDKVRVFDNLLEAKMAIKGAKLGEEFKKHAGLELFIEKD